MRRQGRPKHAYTYIHYIYNRTAECQVQEKDEKNHFIRRISKLWLSFRKTVPHRAAAARDPPTLVWEAWVLKELVP